MKVIMYGYLYVRDGKWGFKVNHREINYYGLNADMLNNRPTEVRKSSGYTLRCKEMEFLEANGKLYGNFEKDDAFEKKELVRVIVDTE